MRRRRSQSDEERLSSLQRALADPGSAWADLLNRLAFWPPSETMRQATELVEAAAERLPAPTRAPSRFVVRELLDGRVRGYIRLLRVLDLGPLWSLRDRHLLLKRMIDEGGLHTLHTFRTRYDHGEALLRTLTRSIRGLQIIYIGGSQVGPAGAQLIARSPSMAGLRHLSLHNNRIGDEGAAALLASPHLHNLRWLNLYRNGISGDMREAIHAAPQWYDAKIILHGSRSVTRPRRHTYRPSPPPMEPGVFGSNSCVDADSDRAQCYDERYAGENLHNGNLHNENCCDDRPNDDRPDDQPLDEGPGTEERRDDGLHDDRESL